MHFNILYKIKCFNRIYIYTNFIKHNGHFLSTYFLLDPFVFWYCFYRIRRELIYIVVCIPSTFCPILGHHQGRIYYKSDVSFVFAYYYYVRASLPLKIIAFAFKWVSVNSVIMTMAQSRTESTRDTYNYGQYINQFPPNTIKAIRQYERIQKKLCRQKMSIMFNEICINEEMLPKYTHTHTHTHTHIYIYIYIYIYI